MADKRRRLFRSVDRTRPVAGKALPHYFLPFREPEDIFISSNSSGKVPQTRYVHHADPTCLLLRTDGACRNNGRRDARAAFAVVHSPPDSYNGSSGTFAFPLEGRDATSNRAEMIAVLAALRCRNWRAEGFSNIIIGTDSNLIVRGITEWARGWEASGWRTAGNRPVRNRDLWQELSEYADCSSKVSLSGERIRLLTMRRIIAVVWNIEAYRHHGVEVSFWKLDRSVNTRADQAAKGKLDEIERPTPYWNL